MRTILQLNDENNLNIGEIEFQSYCNEFFDQLLPKMITWFTEMPKLFKEDSIPLLLPQKQGIVKLSKEQIRCLLTAMFFCCMISVEEYVNSLKPKHSELKGVQFKSESSFVKLLLPHSHFQLQCLLTYFERMANLSKIEEGELKKQFVIFERNVLQKEPDWIKSTKPLCNITYELQGAIEKCTNHAHVDFANRLIGGHFLIGLLAQEEIMFCLKPELIVSVLFCAQMDSNEAIRILGAERYSSCKGYGRSLKFDGKYKDLVSINKDGIRETEVIVIDALQGGGSKQFTYQGILRELNKAYCGFFRNSSKIPIATSHW